MIGAARLRSLPGGRDRPIYVGIVSWTDLAGAAIPFLARILQPGLKHAGRWRGDGPAILIDPGNIARHFRAQTPGCRGEGLRR